MTLGLLFKIALSAREQALAGVPGWVDVTPPQYRLIASMGAPCLHLEKQVTRRGYTKAKARWLAPPGVAAIVTCHLDTGTLEPWPTRSRHRSPQHLLAPLEVRKKCLADCRDCETLANEPTAARKLVSAATKAEGWKVYETAGDPEDLEWHKPHTEWDKTHG
jgi:hypothetical protein